MKEEKIEIQKDYQCFTFLSEEELNLLNTRKTRLLYNKGEQLFKQGALASSVILVLNGMIKRYVEDSSGKINLGISVPGDFMAFQSVFGAETYKYSASAIIDTTVCMIDKTALVNIFKQNREFSYRIAAKNFQKENEMLDKIKSLGFKQMRGKLATSLLYLTQPQFIIYNIFENLSRQDIAEFANISIESTVKLLKEFEKEDILKIRGKNIEILNKKELNNISEKG